MGGTGVFSLSSPWEMSGTGPHSGPAGATAPAHRRAPKALEMSGTGPRSGPAGATAPARRRRESQASGASARRLREMKRVLAPGA